MDGLDSIRRWQFFLVLFGCMNHQGFQPLACSFWQVTMTAFLIWRFWLDSHCSVGWGSAIPGVEILLRGLSWWWFINGLQHGILQTNCNLRPPLIPLACCSFVEINKLRVIAPKTQRILQLGSIGLGYELQQHIVWLCMIKKDTPTSKESNTDSLCLYRMPQDDCQVLDFQGFSFCCGTYMCLLLCICSEVLSFIALDATKPFFVTWAHANKAARDFDDPILVGLDSNLTATPARQFHSHLLVLCRRCSKSFGIAKMVVVHRLWSNSSWHVICNFTQLWRAFFHGPISCVHTSKLEWWSNYVKLKSGSLTVAMYGKRPEANQSAWIFFASVELPRLRKKHLTTSPWCWCRNLACKCSTCCIASSAATKPIEQICFLFGIVWQLIWGHLYQWE